MKKNVFNIQTRSYNFHSEASHFQMENMNTVNMDYRGNFI